MKSVLRWWVSAGGRKARSGQAMLEYIFVFVLLLAVAFALMHLLRAAERTSGRTAVFVSSENS